MNLPSLKISRLSGNDATANWYSSNACIIVERRRHNLPNRLAILTAVATGFMLVILLILDLGEMATGVVHQLRSESPFPDSKEGQVRSMRPKPNPGRRATENYGDGAHGNNLGTQWYSRQDGGFAAGSRL